MAREPQEPPTQNKLNTEEEEGYEDEEQAHDLSAPLSQDEERSACTAINPSSLSSSSGTHHRHTSSTRPGPRTTAGDTWIPAALLARKDYSWQRFSVTLQLEPGRHTVISRAISESGSTQPLSGHRKHVHSVTITVRNSRETWQLNSNIIHLMLNVNQLCNVSLFVTFCI